MQICALRILISPNVNEPHMQRVCNGANETADGYRIANCTACETQNKQILLFIKLFAARFCVLFALYADIYS